MYQEAAEYLKKRVGTDAKIGIILGTGLGQAAEAAEDPVVVPYSEIPNFPVSTVSGHAGRFVSGKIAGKSVMIMQGRVHFYEGYSMAQLAVPVQAMHMLGIEKLIVTNASGGICEDYFPGQIVLIADHIKMTADSPLRGENPDALGSRFFDMTQAYHPALKTAAHAAAAEIGLTLPEGVYAYMGGPQFETPAEIRMLRALGADLVGMSTVPEVITAAHCGMQVLGLSCVTNMAAGMKDGGMNQEVIAQAEEKLKERLKQLIIKVVEKI